MNELRKTGVPSGALRVEIDDPPNRCIEQPVGIIRGWFASSDIEIPDDFSFQLAGIRLPHCIVKREDVEGALPEFTIVGFTIPYDLSDYLPNIQNNRLMIRLMLSGYDPYLMRFTIKDSALSLCLAAASGL